MGFFSDIVGGLKMGANYGRAAKIVQNVFGRNLSPAERELMQTYCQSMAFQADLDPNEIALDFFAFLLTKEEHPSRMLPPQLSESKRSELKRVIIDGVRSGALTLQGYDKQFLESWIAEM